MPLGHRFEAMELLTLQSKENSADYGWPRGFFGHWRRISVLNGQRSGVAFVTNSKKGVTDARPADGSVI